MKTVLCLLFVCLFSGATIFAQTEKRPTEIDVAEITLARDDGAGKAGEIVTSFVTTDVPIHCLIKLNSPKAVAVKMNLVAVKANGLKPGASIVVLNYKTNSEQDGVRFRVSPDGAWATGRYRVDVSLNGKGAKSLEFEIQKSAGQHQPKNFTPNNPAPHRTSKTRKTRKS